MAEFRRSNTRIHLLAVAVAAVVTTAVGACSPPPGNDEPDVIVIETITESVGPAPAVPPATAGPGMGVGVGVGGGLEEFDAFARQLPAQVGLAIVPVGGGQVITGGTVMTDVAWSTIKVPLAIAALTADPAQAGNAAAAITASDNDAAQAMWDDLGSGTAAAAAVQQVLTEFGDPGTVVQPQVTRPGFTAFGQTIWPLTAQAQFAASLPCRGAADEVLTLMGQVSPDQSWGLGALPGARFKGGWGPNPSGGYLVRQFGVADTAAGQVAIAVAAAPTSGVFEDGIAVLDRVASWLAPRLAALTVGSTC